MVSVRDRRRADIIEELARNRVVRVGDLSQRFGVSEMSIRRELHALEQLGLLQRVHGGAVAIPTAPSNHSFASRMHSHVDEKVRIGRAAAELIREGDRIILDSGTTILQVVRSIPPALLDSGNLTVITGSLPNARELSSRNIHLILLGGVYLSEYELAVGPQTIEQLKGLHARKVFIGTDGLTFAQGVTTANVLEAEVDRAMIAAATETIVVADSSKIGVIGLTTSIPLSGITKLVTDTNAPADFVAALREQGVEVILA